MKVARAVALAAAGLLLGATQPAGAAVRSAFAPDPNAPGQGILRVESDGADEILLSCIDAKLLVNGQAPDTGPLDCQRPSRFEITGGPGDNRIDASTVQPTDSGASRGINSSALIDGGQGDDVILGPGGGLVTLVGGGGSDWLQGHSAVDTYRFGPATAPERDVLAEPVGGECNPTFFDTDQPNLTWWTIPWDSIDFRTLPASDPVRFDDRAPGGILASHRNRTVVAARMRAGIALEAVAAGLGDDQLAAACMVDAGPGNDQLTGIGSKGGLLAGGLGDDRLTGGSGPDRLEGGPGADELDGRSADDILDGAAGNDVLRGGVGGDTYLFQAPSGPESDSVVEVVGRRTDTLSFELDGANPVTADLGSRSGVVARSRNHTVRASPSTARLLEGLIGGKGTDRLRGNEGRNHFWSGGGTDLTVGRGGNDVYHVDWIASMPYGAYAWGEFWGGPFERTSTGGRSDDAESAPRSSIRIDERARGGFDTIDVGESWMSSEYSGSRLEGQIASGIRVDLTAARWIARTRRVGASTVRRGGSRYLEGVRGSAGSDTIIGNAANNVLEGRYGRDRVAGGRGSDLCITATDRDRLTSCERRRRANPDR